jgi:hypothetical protein
LDVRINGQSREERRASALMKRVFRALARVGVDLDSVPTSARDAIGLAERNIAALRAIEQQMSRRVHPTAPTPERIRHAITEPDAIEVHPDQPKAHQFVWALEEIRDRLSARQYEAALRLRLTYLARAGGSRVADPTAVGGSSDPSKRLPLTERQERAGRDLAWIMGRLDQPFRSCIRNFVLEEVRHGHERGLTIAEWGARATGLAGDRARRGAGIACIANACSRLANLWDAHDQWQREQCTTTDRMMRTTIGRRAARDGWICALWDFCHREKRLPAVQEEMDAIRAQHDTDVMNLRRLPPIEADRWRRRCDRLSALAFRDLDERVRFA